MHDLARPFPVSLRMTCAVLAIAALSLGGCDNTKPTNTAEPAAAAAPATPPRVVVLGLDAGTWELLTPWMDEGLLPNLARLRDTGAQGTLRSTQPSSSPVIWTSIATGKVPEKTGITWFVRFPEGPGKPVPVDRRARKTKALWNILSDQRIDVAVLGWYVTWPAEPVNGRLQSDLAHFGRVTGGSFPATFQWEQKPIAPEAAIEAMPQFMDFEYDAAKATKNADGSVPPTLDFLVYDRFLRAWARDSFYLESAKSTLSTGLLPEALFLYLRGTDDVQHGFWKFMEPDAFKPRPGPDGKPLAGTVEVPPEQVAAFGKVIPRYWQWIDKEVGELLARYKKSPPLVIVCSDHGAGPAVAEFGVDVPEYLHLSGAHRIDGVLIASGPGIRPGSTIKGATIYDIAPTLLHALNLPIPKDMDGRVLTDLFVDSIAKRPDAQIDTYDSPDQAATPEEQLPDDVDDQVLEHLRSLGYIGQ